MLSVLSPAKTLDFDTPPTIARATQPVLLDESAVLVDRLRKMTASELSSLMGISDKLGRLNSSRYATWETPFTKDNSKQAVLAFKGDVYRGLEAETMSPDDLGFAQKHLRILSGLYGVLRPLDLMQPYRLEMGTSLKNERGDDLYSYWGDRITKDLNQQLGQLKTDTLVNLASVEYFKSVNQDKLNADIVSPVFLDNKNGTYKIISFYAKKARGTMASWIIRNKIERRTELKKFDGDGYRFSKEMSEDANRPTFIRDSKP